MNLSRLHALAGACLPVLFGIAAACGEESRDGILFRASFDSFNTAADKAVNAAATGEGIAPDLQFRMYGDTPDGKGNALTLTVPEYVAWPVKGNFRPDRGTISLWVKPCNYTLSDSKLFQPFLQVKAKRYEIILDKYYHWSNEVCLTFVTYTDSGVRVQYLVCARAIWKENEWHKLDVTWDPNHIALYIDGREPERVPDYPPNMTIDPPAVFPKKLDEGIVTINYPKDWAFLKEGRVTAFDDIEIRDRPLSAKEVFDAFVNKCPERAKGLPAVTAVDRDPVKLTYRCMPKRKEVMVHLDFDAVNLPYAKDYPVRLCLLDRADGSEAVSREVVFPTADASMALPFGNSLKPGHDYDLVAEIKGSKYISRELLRMPDLSFLGCGIGIDHSVPAPWRTVKKESDLCFSVLDRTYEFSAGPFPSRIVSRGQELFSRPPALMLDGKRVEWNRSLLVEDKGDFVRLVSTGKIKGMEFSGVATLWFDGFCQIDFDMSPDSPRDVNIASLRMEWATPMEAARYLLAPNFRPWKDGGFEGRLGFGFNDTSLIWLTGVEKGLAWWRDSSANWIADGTKPNVRIVRDPDVAIVSLDVIAKPVMLAKGRKARYVMGFQGTPAKHPMRTYRTWRFGEPDSKGVGRMTCGWGSSSGKYRPDNFLHWTTLKPIHPEDFEKFIDTLGLKGISVVPYSMPAHLSDLDREWDYFSASWLKHPTTRWDYIDETTQKRGKTMACCGHTSAADWQLKNAKALFERYPKLPGIYYDCSNVESCDNELHGHGGTDVFGQKYQTSTALSLRAFFIRFRKLCQKYGKTFQVHAHNKYFPFVHSLADGCFPGEEQFYPFLNNPRYHYQEGISEEEFQSAWNVEIRGMEIYSFGQSARAKELQPAVVERNYDDYLGRDAVHGFIMSSLIYDFQCMGQYREARRHFEEVAKVLDTLHMDKATFHGYWYDPCAKTGKDIRASAYTWKGGEGVAPFMLVAGNYGRKDAPTGLELDWKRLGTEPCRLKDLLTGRVFAGKELAEYSLRSHNFMLLVPAKEIAK